MNIKSVAGPVSAILVAAALGVGGCTMSELTGQPGPADTPVSASTDSPPPPSAEAGAATTSDAAVPLVKRIQMNDVSILLPLASTAAERDSGMLKPSAAGQGGPLLDEALYFSATGEDGTRITATCHGCLPTTYADLRLVAMRLDPCFAETGSFHAGPTCDNQLRLVFQAVVLSDDGTPKAIDSGVHLFYSVSRAEVVAIANAVEALRIASGRPENLGPLAVHPLAVSEGLGGPFVRGLYGLIQAHAGPAKLMRMARFQVGELSTFWSFHEFDIAGGVATRRSIPTVVPRWPSETDNLVTFSALELPNGVFHGTFGPPTANPDRMVELTDGAKRPQKTPEQLRDGFVAALRVENPTTHTVNTIDCASCHATGLVQLKSGKPLGFSSVGNPNTFTISSPFVSAADMAMTTTLDPPVAGFDIHMFSYFGRAPTITPRVINETARVVDYLNSIRP